MLDGGGSYAIAFADLLHRELASTNAASPARGRYMRGSEHWLLIGASGPHQFATAPRTLSFDHKTLIQLKNSSVTLRMLVARVERMSLRNRELGKITIAAPFQAGRVIALVFGVR